MATSRAKRADEDDDFDGSSIPLLSAGETGTIIAIEIEERKTKPPELLTEATLLEEMMAAAKYIEEDEELRKLFAKSEITGLGTAATRAETIEKLKRHRYIRVAENKKSLVATEKGIALVEWLKKAYPLAVDVAMTARWEAELGQVAKSGGGAAFEAKTYDQIREMVEILKSAPPATGLVSSSPSYTEKSMSETGKPTFTTPTEKMVNFAKLIASRVGCELPADVETSADACRAFIDKHKEAVQRPTEKQLNFATKIAERKGIAVPEDAKNDGRKLSAWIDENKA